MAPLFAGANVFFETGDLPGPTQRATSGAYNIAGLDPGLHNGKTESHADSSRDKPTTPGHVGLVLTTRSELWERNVR